MKHEDQVRGGLLGIITRFEEDLMKNRLKLSLVAMILSLVLVKSGFVIVKSGSYVKSGQ